MSGNKFKIGDRVVQVPTAPLSRIWGWEATLQEVVGVVAYKLSENSIGVDFEKYITSSRNFTPLTHNLHGTIPDATGRWYYVDELELIPQQEFKLLENKEYDNVWE